MCQSSFASPSSLNCVLWPLAVRVAVVCIIGVEQRRPASRTRPFEVSHTTSHRLQHCRAPVQALVSQRVQRTRTSELMGRLAEAFCEHLMHGAAAARMSACMAKPAVTSCQAALSAGRKVERYDTNCTETFEKLIELHCVWASDTEGGSAVACVCTCGLRTRRGGSTDDGCMHACARICGRGFRDRQTDGHTFERRGAGTFSSPE